MCPCCITGGTDRRRVLTIYQTRIRIAPTTTTPPIAIPAIAPALTCEDGDVDADADADADADVDVTDVAGRTALVGTKILKILN